jgi:biotin-dependent carboxylase-like uncharacterized protein
MGKIKLLRAGPLTSVQDLGRPSSRAYGVAPGGALDPFAAQLVNLLVGNPVGAALLEVNLGGVRLAFEDTRALAWAGGEFEVRIGEIPLPPGRRGIVRQNEEVKIGSSRRGPRAWLAISGGIDVPPVLGSRATDLRAGFGGDDGRLLADGDEISLGEADIVCAKTERIAAWSAPLEWSQPARQPHVLRVLPGAGWDLYRRETQTAFLEMPFTVGALSDRMGLRLEGPELPRKEKHELLSEAVVPGTIQVANNDQPILLLGDCQTIGGYPKIAHVITVDLARTAQLQPNDSVRFERVEMAEAVALYRARENELRRFQVGLSLRRR